MKVLIIDNDRASGRLKFLLESESAGTTGSPVEAACGANASRVWERVMENPFYYDVLIVNYDLNEFNESMLLARFEDLRRVNPSVILFLSTGSRFLPVEFLDCGFTGVLSKPYERQRVRRVLDRVKRRRELQGPQNIPLFSADCGGVRQTLLVSDIFYGQKSRGGMRLVTEKGEWMYRVSLEDFDRREYRFFCRCHNSFVVNIRHVKQIKKDGFTLENGEFIPISRSYRPVVRKFLKNGGRGTADVPGAASAGLPDGSSFQAAESMVEYKA